MTIFWFIFSFENINHLLTFHVKWSIFYSISVRHEARKFINHCPKLYYMLTLNNLHGEWNALSLSLAHVLPLLPQVNYPYQVSHAGMLAKNSYIIPGITRYTTTLQTTLKRAHNSEVFGRNLSSEFVSIPVFTTWQVYSVCLGLQRKGARSPNNKKSANTGEMAWQIVKINFGELKISGNSLT